MTPVKDAADRYIVSFVVESDPADEILPPLPGAPDLGIDLGLTHFVVCSDGSLIKSPRFLRRAEKKLKREQARLARKTKGSNNRDKQRITVARAHAKAANARKDFHHKLSTKLIRENQAVTVESLSVKALARGLHSKSVHDAGWSQFVNMLEYKAARYGRTFTQVARDFPSSQLCSASLELCVCLWFPGFSGAAWPCAVAVRWSDPRGEGVGLGGVQVVEAGPLGGAGASSTGSV